MQHKLYSDVPNLAIGTRPLKKPNKAIKLIEGIQETTSKPKSDADAIDDATRLSLNFNAKAPKAKAKEL